LFEDFGSKPFKRLNVPEFKVITIELQFKFHIGSTK